MKNYNVPFSLNFKNENEIQFFILKEDVKYTKMLVEIFKNTEIESYLYVSTFIYLFNYIYFLSKEMGHLRLSFQAF
jgi:hypothetical protein